MCIESYTLETTHVLQLLNGVCWMKGYGWGTLVSSLYSSILHEQGLFAVQYHLEKYSNYSGTLIQFILKAICFLLENNYFIFDACFYLQSCGTAIGAKFAPSYANLYMVWWEETHISVVMRGHLKMYLQYIEDLLCIWSVRIIEHWRKEYGNI